MVEEGCHFCLINDSLLDFAFVDNSEASHFRVSLTELP
jgi:hypothetical protein